MELEIGTATLVYTVRFTLAVGRETGTCFHCNAAIGRTSVPMLVRAWTQCGELPADDPEVTAILGMIAEVTRYPVCKNPACIEKTARWIRALEHAAND